MVVNHEKGVNELILVWSYILVFVLVVTINWLGYILYTHLVLVSFTVTDFIHASFNDFSNVLHTQKLHRLSTLLKRKA